MRKGMMVLLAVVALAGGTLMAAGIENLNGQSCGDSTGNWHFVNNQTGGAPAGQLTAVFESGTCVVGPSKVLSNTQHFDCAGYGGDLISATTGDLPGRLVLSDFSCETKEPPKCDPKTDPNCKP